MRRIGAWLGGPTSGMKALVALACLVMLLSSGCSAEQPSPTSGSHKETKNTQAPVQDEARSEARESTTEAAKPAPKEAAGQGAANPESKPKPQSKPKPKPEPIPKRTPSQEPKPATPEMNTVRPARGATVTVSNVIDGDTIEVSPAVNGLKDVRLIGVDTPETVDPSDD